MNIEDVRKMTKEEKRVKIAEMCGWSMRGMDNGSVKFHSPSGKFCGYYYPPEVPEIGEQPEAMPDYLNDLNAMAEARKTLKQDHVSQDFQQARFIRKLENIVSLVPGFNDWTWALVNSTAEQQADAFLAVMLP
jgi:hypothetical protein